MKFLSIPMDARAAAEALLEKRGAGRYSLGVLCLCGFGWMSDGAENVVLSYMLPTLEDLWSLSPGQLGAMSTAIYFGQAAGATFWGALADAGGRRPVFLLSLALTVLFGVASSAAPGFYTYCMLRLVTGFAIGGAAVLSRRNLPLAVSLASELLPPSLRDRGVVALQLFNEIGSLGSTGLAALLLPGRWRLYLCLVALPAAAVLAAAAFALPESPLWLISAGRGGEAAQVLASISAGGSGVTRLLPRSRTLASADAQSRIVAARGGGEGCDGDGTVGLPPARDDRADRARRPRLAIGCPHRLGGALRPVRGLCVASLRPTTTLLAALWFAANFGSGWWAWTPELAKRQGLAPASMYVAMTVARVVAMAAFVLAAAVIRRTGAYPLLLSALAGTLAWSLALTWIVDSRERFASDLFVVAYALFALTFGIVWPVLYVVTPAAFPATARGAGFGLVSAFSKLGGLTCPNVVALLLPPASPPPPSAPPEASSRQGLAPLLGHEQPALHRIGLLFTVGWAIALGTAALQAARHHDVSDAEAAEEPCATSTAPPVPSPAPAPDRSMPMAPAVERSDSEERASV
ncbi:hypothetical protein EMIHUDRAFT_221745 [Emiliania huxleyi CCMP1516]|uniref:Major facilitator superfamily (MFS) profile domain-containing protein n=2 Tax=Emiliania huxleyi TaxID=2903 RepID=A0A0D3HY49_EMIH1|nr:hypothetical protein EMIHUDRAFT_221745 [Emiliania huxleyi CCMP1516]EOD03934.1 hypothetical protein EMIHUDRAFT_221745 [Emiliania huxleyi CCMP1516]|eukprot:XP_005756363.1 hypothetical protein EMIHUDRAFT_221745 [Emiliania huxleyi CCMP1516]